MFSARPITWMPARRTSPVVESEPGHAAVGQPLPDHHRAEEERVLHLLSGFRRLESLGFPEVVEDPGELFEPVGRRGVDDLDAVKRRPRLLRLSSIAPWSPMRIGVTICLSVRDSGGLDRPLVGRIGKDDGSS